MEHAALVPPVLCEHQEGPPRAVRASRCRDLAVVAAGIDEDGAHRDVGGQHTDSPGSPHVPYGGVHVPSVRDAQASHALASVALFRSVLLASFSRALSCRVP